jgi:hypothetical protein
MEGLSCLKFSSTVWIDNKCAHRLTVVSTLTILSVGPSNISVLDSYAS